MTLITGVKKNMKPKVMKIWDCLIFSNPSQRESLSLEMFAQI
ncbi:hypothetical protein BTN49_1133 [Candidatus Enterovibrio escicola]|uniref:Uncharacterized protein n=1 Tax=Candidatus Enterovibrio escicola TaxID=1927127 RepID=A0A2A5T4T3_9GAMM|nr:transposase [Candidatus Enterovibrio escacola]PCS23138.1 hypothetical protein BTN49_1133 [Candidatus Enterovibrio escacola]